MNLSQPGVTIWLTGLSGAGKSTIATALERRLTAQGRLVEVLDGDVVRENLSRGLGFSKEDRDTNIRRIGFVAGLLSRNGVVAIVAAISPYSAIRDEVRGQVANFVEVHVDCPMDELLRRDVKGLYKRALAGEIEHFTGVSDPYEAPVNPELRVDTSRSTLEEEVARIIALIPGEQETGPGSPRLEVADVPGRPASSNRDTAPLPGPSTPHGGTLEVRLVGAERHNELASEAAGLELVELDAWALSDLELLGGGGLSPLTGFLGEADLLSVRDNIRLADGTVWSLPVILPVEQSSARRLKPGQRVALTSGGQVLAVMAVDEAFAYDPSGLAEAVYGTGDTAHPGVARMSSQPGFTLAGSVEVLDLPEGTFPEYRLTPTQTRQAFDQRGWTTVVAFQTRNPVHRAHEYLQKVALEQVDGLLLHPLVGETKGDDIPASTRMRCYRALLDHYYPQDRVLLSVFPASMRYAGPREAIFHALVRKNYGCTHFIVGRDHAGVGSYYGTFDAQRIFDRFTQEEIGIQLLKFDHSFWCRACEGMVTSRTCPHDDSEHLILSGTRVRELLRSGAPLPMEFTRPEVAEILREAELARVTEAGA